MGRSLGHLSIFAILVVSLLMPSNSHAWDVYLKPKIAAGEAIAYDSGWSILPSNFNGISLSSGAGAVGSIGFVVQGTYFGQGSVADWSAIGVIPPSSGDRTAHLYTNTYEVTGYQRTESFWFNASVGLVANDATSQVIVRLKATGWDFGASTPTSAVLGEQVISAGPGAQIWIPVGAWALKPGAQLIIEVVDISPATSRPMLVMNQARFFDAGPRPAQSISEPSISYLSPAAQAGYLGVLDKLPSKWFRGSLHGTPEMALDAAIFKRASATGKKNLAVITSHPADFLLAGSEAYGEGDPQHAVFLSRCGSPFAYRLSYVDVPSFKNRIRSILQTFAAQGVAVDAFEVGNELDSVCFNGDLSLNAPLVSDAELTWQANAYGRVLEAAIEVISEFDSYRSAKIITYGIAHTRIHSDADLYYHTGYIMEPEKQIAKLANYGGQNLLSKVYAYGVHYYPYPQHLDPQGIERVKVSASTIAAVLASNPKPLWVTEWGFSTDWYSGVPAVSDARASDFFAFYSAIMGVPNARVENAFHYAISSASWRLVYDDFTFRPEAYFLFNYK